jgi:hypothetical protein
MADGKKLCVLTVHGIGFQQPPTDSAAGYADVLHENLRCVRDFARKQWPLRGSAADVLM